MRRWNVSVEDFFDVGAADAASGDFDQDFVVAYFGDGDFFDADDTLFAVDAGVHGLGNGPKCLQYSGHGGRLTHEATC